jgi:hypothetical protein
MADQHTWEVEPPALAGGRVGDAAASGAPIPFICGAWPQDGCGVRTLREAGER